RRAAPEQNATVTALVSAHARDDAHGQKMSFVQTAVVLVQFVSGMRPPVVSRRSVSAFIGSLGSLTFFFDLIIGGGAFRVWQADVEVGGGDRATSGVIRRRERRTWIRAEKAGSARRARSAPPRAPAPGRRLRRPVIAQAQTP